MKFKDKVEFYKDLYPGLADVTMQVESANHGTCERVNLSINFSNFEELEAYNIFHKNHGYDTDMIGCILLDHVMIDGYKQLHDMLLPDSPEKAIN